MSRDIKSDIFSAIINYFVKFSPPWVSHIESISPVDGADIYHYHRPHLEKSLLSNSVCTVHHDLNDTDPWHARHNFISKYRESDAVICLNKSQVNILNVEEGLPLSKLFVVPHGYNQDLLSLKKHDSSRGEKFVLGIASRRYDRRVKGEAYLHELIKRLDPSVVKFILVGQGRSFDAIEMRSYGFDVEVFEYLPYRVFQGFYESIDCLLMCSGYEGGPANIPEALATGTPVLASGVGIALDSVVNGKNGFFLDMSPSDDANLIHRLALNRESFISLEATCKQLANDVPTWKYSIEENIKIYSYIAGLNFSLSPLMMLDKSISDVLDTDISKN